MLGVIQQILRQSGTTVISEIVLSVMKVKMDLFLQSHHFLHIVKLRLQGSNFELTLISISQQEQEHSPKLSKKPVLSVMNQTTRAMAQLGVNFIN